MRGKHATVVAGRPWLGSLWSLRAPILQSRTAYSLRHTYICMRLMEGADIYQIAKNCRTSVGMIETYYASHIKNTLDAAAINVMKPKKAKKGRKPLKKDEDDDE